MSAATLTLRQTTDDAATQLRRLVAECVLGAARERGVAMVDWLAAVDRLHLAIQQLEALRRGGASRAARATAADEVSIALVSVISIYDAAQARLDVLLADRPDLRDARLEMAASSTDVMDPALHGSLADRVCAALDEPAAPRVLVL